MLRRHGQWTADEHCGSGLSGSANFVSDCPPLGIVRGSSIFLCAVVITAWLVWSCCRLENLFVRNYGYFYDAAAYLKWHIALYHAYLQQGAWATICSDFLSNDRCPLRTLPYLMLAPRLLIEESGHLWTEIPFLFSLLVLFGALVARRTASVLFALTAMTTFIAMPFLYDPMHGIAAFWLDLTAAFALGCAAVSLLFFHETGQKRWVFAFGCFLSATVLCRWWSTIHVAAFSCLALPVVLSRKELSLKARVLSCGCTLLGALPGMAFAISSFPTSWAYYKVAGCALNHTVIESVQWTAVSLLAMFGLPVLAVLLTLSVINLANWDRRRENWRPAFVCLWFTLSLVLVTCLVCRIAGGEHALAYFLPAVTIMAFVPGPIDGSRRWLVAGTCLSLLALNITSAALSYDRFRRITNNPGGQHQLQKSTDVELASLIASTGSKSFLEFDTQTIYPQLEAFYKYGIYCPESACFSIHEYHMKGLYPNKSASDVAKAAYEEVCRTVDLIAVFARPEEARGKFDNSYSECTAIYVSEQVRQDSRWKALKAVNSPRGMLCVYHNRQSQR